MVSVEAGLKPGLFSPYNAFIPQQHSEFLIFLYLCVDSQAFSPALKPLFHS